MNQNTEQNNTNLTRKASLWTIAAFASEQILRLLSNLILTRLLMPEVFGLMAIITVVRIGVSMCTEMGIKVNIIRHELSNDPVVLNTAWTMQVVRGVIVFFVILLIAQGIVTCNTLGLIDPSSVYAEADLPLLLSVMAVTSITLGLESSKIWLATRAMQLGKVTLVQLVSQLLGLIFMILIAWYYHSIWAIVIGSIVSSTSLALLSHIAFEGANNKFCWNNKIVKEFLHFGKWMFLSAAMTFFASNGDRVILGGLISAEQLGFYSISFFLASAMRQMAEKLSMDVWLPLFSKVNRENPAALNQVYYKVRQKLDICIFFTIGFLYTTAHLIISILYDDRYSQSAWMLQVLSLSLIAVCYRQGNTLLLAKGNPKFEAFVIGLRSVALVGLLPVSFHYFGLEGAVWCVALTPLVEVPVILYYFSKQKMINWGKEFLYIPFIFVGYMCGSALVKIYSFAFS